MERAGRKMEGKFSVGGVPDRVHTDTHLQHKRVTPRRPPPRKHTVSQNYACINKKQGDKTDMQGYTIHTRWGLLCLLFLSSHTHTSLHTLCGLVAAAADAVHEYFSQTLWQSFHLHGPDVSSWNIYHSGPERGRPKLCLSVYNLSWMCARLFFVFMLNLCVWLFVCLFIKVTVCFCLFFSHSFRRRLPSGWMWSVPSSSPTCRRRWDTHTLPTMLTRTHSVFSFLSLLGDRNLDRKMSMHIFINIFHT